MQIEIHVLVAGSGAITKMQMVKEFTTTKEKARAECAAQFRAMVEADPDVPPLIVVWKGLTPVVIASELIQSLPPSIREKQGKPARELIWVSDHITSV